MTFDPIDISRQRLGLEYVDGEAGQVPRANASTTAASSTIAALDMLTNHAVGSFSAIVAASTSPRAVD